MASQSRIDNQRGAVQVQSKIKEIVQSNANEFETKMGLKGDRFQTQQPAETSQQPLATLAAQLQILQAQVAQFEQDAEAMNDEEKQQTRAALQLKSKGLMKTWGTYLLSLRRFDEAVEQEEEEIELLENQIILIALTLKIGPGAPMQVLSILPEFNLAPSSASDGVESSFEDLMTALLKPGALTVKEMQRMIKTVLADLKKNDPKIYTQVVQITQRSNPANCLDNMSEFLRYHPDDPNLAFFYHMCDPATQIKPQDDSASSAELQGGGQRSHLMYSVLCAAAGISREDTQQGGTPDNIETIKSVVSSPSGPGNGAGGS